MAQAIHAALAFAHLQPDSFETWTTKSNYLVCLSVPNEISLLTLINRARREGIPFQVFQEPDLDNEYTAAAFEPGQAARDLCKNLPLALRGRE